MKLLHDQRMNLLFSLNQMIIMIFFFYFFTIFLTNFNIKADNNNINIPQICREFSEQDPNIDYNFCSSSLESGVRKDLTGLYHLGKISFKLVRKNVTSTRKYAKKLIKNKGSESGMKSCLNDCLELYSDALTLVAEAKENYKSRHYEDANIKISAVMDASSTCEDGFNETGVVSPLTGRNNNVFGLTAILLSIINMHPA